MRILSDPRRGERGSITVLTALLMTGLVLAVGLCLDMARIYMVRAELQNAADAAALSAARELNSGTTGINAAYAAATASALSSSNSYGLGNTSITITNVEFARNLPVSGAESYTSKATFDAMTTSAKDAFAATVRFVRVTTSTANINVLFTIGTIGASRSETAQATAGRSIELNNICNLFPIGVFKTNAATSFAANVPIDLNFRDGTGTTFDAAHLDYVVLATNGNGANMTRDAAAGVINTCASVGSNIDIGKSSSANLQNGPYQIEEGLNTRFDIYRNGGGHPQADIAPPDPNIFQDPNKIFANFNWTNYKNGSPVLAPANTPQTARRIIVMPLLEPGTYANQVRVERFGAFLVLNSMTNPTQPSACDNSISNPCGDLRVEYLGDDFPIGGGSYDPNNTGTTNLTVSVLYK